MLAIGAISDLRDAGAREAARLGLVSNGPTLHADHDAALNAARERAELAAAEVHNQHPHLRAPTLIGIHGNLDGLVESLVPSLHEMRASTLVARQLDRAREDGTIAEALAAVPPEHVDAIRKAMVRVLVDQAPSCRWGRVSGDNGAERWEAPLRVVGLGAPPGRPIPGDLDAALGELSALRDVLVHRAGRIDERAMTKWPRLVRFGLRVGDFVRIDRRNYRRYSAAVRCYGSEIVRRLVAHSVPAVDVDLANWESYAPLME